MDRGSRRIAFRVLVLALGGLMLNGAASACRGAVPRRFVDSIDLPAGARVLRDCVPRFSPPEVVEMLLAITSGSETAVKESWFHPGRARRGWDWLAARYDRDHDGVITRAEFGGPAEWFDRLDHNGDGRLTAEDFHWTARSTPPPGVVPWFQKVDTDRDGRISRREWEAFFDRASAGKDYLTPEDLREAVAPSVQKSKESKGGTPVWVLLRGVLNGDIGSIWEGPAVGRQAPDFALRTADGQQAVRLSQYRGRRPVVLVFGSFT